MGSLDTHNPFTGEKLKSYAMDDLSSVQNKIKTARQSQKQWALLSLPERVKLVHQAAQYFETHKEQIAKDISLEMGRPLSQARGEIRGFFERTNYMCEIAAQALAPDVIEDSAKFYRAIEHVPKGLIFVISAWNYPLLVTVNSVVPALIAGNVVLLKHSSLTPAIGQHFAAAFSKIGKFEGLLQNVIVDHKTTGQIIEELPIDHVVFTGSVTGGRKILEHSAKKFMAPQLELGGKDAAYVDSDADLDYAVATVVDGAMFNSGQSCCGIERVYICADVHEQFVEKCKTLIETYKLGDPLDEKTSLGPLANAKSVDLMLKQIQQAVEHGARIITGGTDVKMGQGRFLKPTLLTQVKQSEEIVQEENFGPILPVIKVKDANEAIQLINDSPYGLTCALFTSDLKKAEDMARMIDTGTVFMNRCDYLDPALPWTGVKWSGCGSALSKYGFHSVTRLKALHFKKSL